MGGASLIGQDACVSERHVEQVQHHLRGGKKEDSLRKTQPTHHSLSPPIPVSGVIGVRQVLEC